MTVVIRADASVAIGTGHVMRCLALAGALAARGWRVIFVMRQDEGHLGAVVAAAGFERRWLQGATTMDENADAAATLNAIGTSRPVWLVVDHYDLSRAWERIAGTAADHVLVIDDLANRAHQCEVLLDQNVPAASERYHGLVPAGARLLCGPAFALLGDAFAPPAFNVAPARDEARRVLVAFGGTDRLDLTSRALDALSQAALADLEVDVAMGPTCPHLARVQAAAAVRPRTRVHVAPPDLAGLLATADVAIGAGGGSLWERCRAGVPAVVISAAPNQESACAWLGRQGIVAYAGTEAEVTPAQLAAEVAALVGDGARRAAMRQAARALVDGRGAHRVAETLVAHAGERRVVRRHAVHARRVRPTAFDGFTLEWIDQRPASEVLRLRNADHVRVQMREPAGITEAGHAAFLADYDRADRVDFVLVETATGRGVGAVYITDLSRQPAIGKYIGDPAFLRRGLARQAMTALIAFGRDHLGLRELTAVTRADNARNQALNESLGFRPGPVREGFMTMTIEL